MSVIRSESKLKDVDEKIQALFDEKHVKIIKAEEEAEQEAEQTQEELIGIMCKAIISNAESIQKILEQGGLSLPEEEEEEENKEENLEKLTKSLENIGLTGKWQSIKKRIKIQ